MEASYRARREIHYSDVYKRSLYGQARSALAIAVTQLVNEYLQGDGSYVTRSSSEAVIAQAYLDAGRATGPNAVVLMGPTGTGKSTLARRFAIRSSANFVEINARTELTYRRDLIALCAKLGHSIDNSVSGEQELAAEAVSKLMASELSWCVYLDDVTEAHRLEWFMLDAPALQILASTNKPECLARGAKVVSVGEMTDAEAANMCERRLAGSGIKYVDIEPMTLRLPIAIEHTLTMIRVAGLSSSDLAGLAGSRFLQLYATNVPGHSISLADVYGEIWSSLCQRNTEASDILRLLTIGEPDVQTRFYLRSAFTHLSGVNHDALAFANGLTALIDFHLVRLDGDVVVLHTFAWKMLGMILTASLDRRDEASAILRALAGEAFGKLLSRSYGAHISVFASSAARALPFRAAAKTEDVLQARLGVCLTVLYEVGVQTETVEAAIADLKRRFPDYLAVEFAQSEQIIEEQLFYHSLATIDAALSGANPARAHRIFGFLEHVTAAEKLCDDRVQYLVVAGLERFAHKNDLLVVHFGQRLLERLKQTVVAAELLTQYINVVMSGAYARLGDRTLARRMIDPLIMSFSTLADTPPTHLEGLLFTAVSQSWTPETARTDEAFLASAIDWIERTSPSRRDLTEAVILAQCALTSILAMRAMEKGTPLPIWPEVITLDKLTNIMADRDPRLMYARLDYLRVRALCDVFVEADKQALLKLIVDAVHSESAHLTLRSYMLWVKTQNTDGLAYPGVASELGANAAWAGRHGFNDLYFELELLRIMMDGVNEGEMNEALALFATNAKERASVWNQVMELWTHVSVRSIVLF